MSFYLGVKYKLIIIGPVSFASCMDANQNSVETLYIKKKNAVLTFGRCDGDN